MDDEHLPAESSSSATLTPSGIGPSEAGPSESGRLEATTTPVEEPENGTVPITRSWGLPRTIGFRFLCIYLLFNTLPFPISYLPGGSAVDSFVQSVWDQVIPAFGHAVLGIEGEIAVGPSGSGDRMVNYVTVAFHLCLAALGCFLWSLLDRRRRHPKLQHWLVIGVRYYLGTYLLIYGIIKLFGSQFPPPTLTTLLQAYGDSSPMHLVWTFMGFSWPYTAFSGAGEAIAGIFLLFRRTTTLGALISLGVMSNVVMFNFAYDVPVKLFSSHLWLMSLGLLILDRQRLIQVFWGQGALPHRALGRAFQGRRAHRLGLVAKLAFVGFFLFQQTYQSYERFYGDYGRGRTKPPLYGIWTVESFVVDGQELPPLTTEDLRWRHLVIDWNGFAAAHFMDGHFQYLTFRVDPEQKSIEVGIRKPNAETQTWEFSSLDDEALPLQSLELTGELEDSRYQLRLKARSLDDFLLTNRGFHWINEFPFNR